MEDPKTHFLFMGGYKLNSSDVFGYILTRVTDEGLLGKPYNTTSESQYVCTTFVQEVLELLGLNSSEYIASNQKVLDSINMAKQSLFEAGDTNPSEGNYVFYFDYGDGTGHTGFVNFDPKGKAKILHNGSNGNGSFCVNLRTRDSRKLKSWFNCETGTLYYKKLEYYLWTE